MKTQFLFLKKKGTEPYKMFMNKKNGGYAFLLIA